MPPYFKAEGNMRTRLLNVFGKRFTRKKSLDKKRRQKHLSCLSITGAVIFRMVLGFCSPAEASDSAWDSLTGGKVSADFRYRYEWVDQAGFDKDANASTLRTRLGYETGMYEGLGGYLEFEDVTVVGDESYDKTKNGRMQYPVVADPSDTEVNQAYVKYAGLESTIVQVGRRRVILDNARFVGNVGWRQNEQTYDTVSLVNDFLPSTTLTYAYVYNVNRIFGAHYPTKDSSANISAPSAHFRMHSHLANLSFNRYKSAVLTGYGYFLDFETSPAASTKTIGLRVTGSHPILAEAEIVYELEYADQSDFADGARTNDADYMLGGFGGTVRFVTVKISYEVLGGDGVYGFATPLATLHGFQGWADKFLATPPDGIVDLFLTVSAKLMDAKLAAVYHDFSSDHDGFDYGTELDLLAVKTFQERYTFGVKYAHYEAESNAKNVGPPSSDVDKLWLTTELKF